MLKKWSTSKQQFEAKLEEDDPIHQQHEEWIFLAAPVSLLSSVVQTIINVINVIFISPIFLMSYFCVVLYNYFLQCNAGHEKLIFSLVQEWKDWKCMQINFSSCNCSVETWFYANVRENKRFISSFSPSCRKTIST